MHLVILFTYKIKEVGLWNLIAWGEAGLAAIDGSTYWVKGNNAALGPSFDILKEMPGGLYTYGIAMLLLSGLIMYSTGKPGRFAERVQFAVFVLGLLISVSIMVSWFEADDYQTNAISKWFFVTWSALALYLTAGRNRRVTPDKE